MSNRELIRNILKDITVKASSSNNKDRTKTTGTNLNIKKRVVVLFTGSNIKLDEVIKGLRNLKQQNYLLTLCFSENAERILDKDRILTIVKPEKVLLERDRDRYMDIVNFTDMAIVPILTQNTLAKVSTGVQDNFITMLLWQILWLGKKVIINPDSALSNRGTHCRNSKMLNLIKKHVDKLKEFGADIIHDHDYLNHIEINIETGQDNEKSSSNEEQSKVKELITERDILNLVGKKDNLYLTKGTIITPLARDTAKEKKIRIIYR